MNTEATVKRLVIYIDLFVDDFNFIAGNADYPFDVILRAIKRIPEHNYIIALRSFYVDQFRPGKWVLDAVNKLIYQNVIANQQGVFHGTGRDFKGLHYKSPNKEGQDQGNCNGLSIFSEE